MTSPEQEAARSPAGESALPGLEDLLPIAVVIGAGCERCAGRLVRRARRRGTSKELIARALGIAAGTCSADGLGRAVGAEAAGRARKAVQAAQQALHEGPDREEDCGCCRPRWDNP